MSEKVLGKESRLNFIEFKDFKTSEIGSSKRIKLSSIEEYYISKKGILTVHHSGKVSMFEYRDLLLTNKLLEKIDYLFNVKRL